MTRKAPTTHRAVNPWEGRPDPAQLPSPSCSKENTPTTWNLWKVTLVLVIVSLLIGKIALSWAYLNHCYYTYRALFHRSHSIIEEIASLNQSMIESIEADNKWYEEYGIHGIYYQQIDSCSVSFPLMTVLIKQTSFIQ